MTVRSSGQSVRVGNERRAMSPAMRIGRLNTMALGLQRKRAALLEAEERLRREMKNAAEAGLSLRTIARAAHMGKTSVAEKIR